MRRRWIVRSAVVTVGVLLAGTASAQSANDGFNPAPNDNVYRVAVQPDGHILVAGAFTSIAGGSPSRTAVARLRHDGTLDTTFNALANNAIAGLALQPDGRILVGGSFTTLGGLPVARLGRLHANGQLDEGFNAPSINGPVQVLGLQVDGRILVGGPFTEVHGETRSGFVRLHPDGTPDSVTANVTGLTATVLAFAEQPDGGVFIGGNFTHVNSVSRPSLARLRPDGSLDPDFQPALPGECRAILVQPDGLLLVAGGTAMSGYVRRLFPDGTPDPRFEVATNGIVLTLARAADGAVVAGGLFTTIDGVARSNLARLSRHGEVDPGFNPGANERVSALAVQADGQILAGGFFSGLGGGGTTTRNHLGRLHPTGHLDTTFAPGANFSVRTLALQPDGKVLVGGVFTSVADQPRNRLARLHADGSLDTTFDPGANNLVSTLALQPDGKVLVGGDFTSVASQPRLNLARLHADGSLDTTFHPGVNNEVWTLALQSDGRVLVGGDFTSVAGQPRNRLARLHDDGSLDTTFDPGANILVSTLALQPDGKVLVGGVFTSVADQPRNRLARLHADGSLDTTFDPGANNLVSTLALQPDGKVLVGGDFTSVAGQPRNRLARLHADGSLDTTFDPGANILVSTLALQPDGKVLVGGHFTSVAGQPRNRLARLHADGSLDTTFDPGANNWVSTLALQPDGKVLVGGSFTSVAGQPRNSLARVTVREAALQALDASAAGAVTWIRRASGPEVERVTFELSLDGLTYSLLATPARIADGWQVTGASLPRNRHLWLRARADGGTDGRASVRVESVRHLYFADAFTDATLVRGVTVVRAAHLTELRTRVNALRTRYGLATATWTNPALTGLPIRALHLEELVSALAAAFAVAGAMPPAPLVLPSAGDPIRAADIMSLRRAVLSLETE